MPGGYRTNEYYRSQARTRSVGDLLRAAAAAADRTFGQGIAPQSDYDLFRPHAGPGLLDALFGTGGSSGMSDYDRLKPR
jgi:hypothetical protein